MTFIGILNACSHGGLVEEGWKHFTSMKSVYQIEPKIEHYGCLIDLLGRAGLLKEAEEKNQVIMKSEVGGFRVIKRTLLANIYASVGRWEDVKNVRSKIRVIGIRKEPG
ncbi:pentatricopeptide repeat-containing protein [Tanacetum coccineum]